MVEKIAGISLFKGSGKYVLIPVVISLIGYVLLYLTYGVVKRDAIQDLNDRQMIHAKQATKGIESYFGDHIEILQILARNEHIAALDQGGKRMMREFHEAHSKDISILSRLDSEGRILHAEPYDPRVIDQFVSKMEDFEPIKHTRSVSFSDVFINRRGDRSIVLHYPIFEADHFTGSLTMLLPFDLIAKRYIGDIQIGKDGYAWVISRDGIEISCPVPGHAGHSVFENCREFPDVLAMAERMTRGEQGSATYTFDHVRADTVAKVTKHAVFMPVRFGNNFWSIVVATPEDEVTRGLEGFRNRLIAVAVFLVIGMGLFFTLMFRAGLAVQEMEQRKKVEAEANVALRLEVEQRKRAEEALRESEELYRTLVDASPDPISVADIHGRHIFASRKALEVFGHLAVEEVVGRSVLEWVSPEQQDKASTDLEGLIARGTLNGREYTLIKKDGTHFVGEIGAAIFHRPDGNPRGILFVTRDITERKAAEQALNASEAKFRSYIESAPLGIFTADRQGRLMDFNPAATQLLGYDASTLGNMSIKDLHPEEDREEVLKDFATLLEARHVETERRIVRRDGKAIWVSLHVVMISDELSLGYCRDVTERKRAQEALRESEEQFKAMFETASIGMAQADPKTGLWLRVNRKMADITGYSPAEMLTLRVPEITHPEDRERDWAAFRSVVAGESESYRLEKRYIRKDGSIIWVNVNMTVIRDSAGQPVRTLATIEDISERKRAEEEQAKLQDRLLQSHKMESIGRLAGGVAHDFNNMLSIILGRIEMALDEVDRDQPLFTDLEEIRKAAEHSADLTRQLLAFARRQTVVPKVLDLNGTLEGMLKMLRRLIGENIDLAWRPGVNLWSVKADPSQIDQILVNLCVNARDAIGGVGKLTIETENVAFDEVYCAEHSWSEPGEYVLLAVSDDGCGMDKETLDKLFEPFFTTKGVGKGTGLGLATVYGIVKQNNGFIDVYSEPGRGASFKICLPRYKDKNGQPGKNVPVEPTGPGHETILLVEDEPAILNMTRKMLERQGYTVLSASTPGEAARRAEEYSGRIDLLMTDVVMPGMNGRDLANSLLSLYPRLKRLFMSGYPAEVIAHHGVLDEGVNFIQKPFSKHTLAEKLREVLNGNDG